MESHNEYRERPNRYPILNHDPEPRLTIDCKVETLLGIRSTLLVLNHPDTTITEGVLEAFSFLTNLQELHLEQNVWRELENKQLMEQLLSKRSELKRDVKIYFNDILIANSFVNSNYNRSILEKIEHYGRLPDCVRSVFEINYNELTNFLNDPKIDHAGKGIALERISS